MSDQIMPEINQALCIACGDCVVSCPRGALALVDDKIVLNEARCAYCGDCEDVCPVGAIALPYDIVIRDNNSSEGED